MQATAEHVVNPAVVSQTAAPKGPYSDRYAKVIEVSKRVRWDIERDVFRGRNFDFSKKFLPDSLSKLGELTFVTPEEDRFLSQIQGRTYANVFGLVERFIGAKVLELSQDHWLGDQVALEALVRFTDEELKHQEMFRRLERMAAAEMPDGYDFKPQPNDVANAVLSKSTWAVLGADARHRTIHAGTLPRQHRTRLRIVGTVEGRVPVSLERGIAARDPRRTGVDARGRAASASGSEIRAWTT